MKYLGQDKNANEIIKDELIRAGIEPVEVEPYIDNKTDECVEFNYGGLLKTDHGDITFRRDWYYWRAKGKVPLYQARLIYAHPEGKANVRVSGHCGCPPPEWPWVDWIDDNGYKLGNISELDAYDKDSIVWESIDKDTMIFKSSQIRMVESPEKEGKPFITDYHIDTQAGLLLFAEVIKGINVR